MVSIIYSESSATHLVGGFISYQYLRPTSAGARYRITIVSYRDCKAGSINFADDIDVCFYNRSNNNLYSSENFRISNKGKVQPIGRTDCPETVSVCLERAFYIKDVELPTSSFGYFVKYEVCCRNEQVNLRSDINGDPFIGQTYQTIIPPTNLKNSSPFFQDVPVPFICANDTTSLSNYAIDPDGDSLVYKLATPWYGASLANNFPGCSPRYTAPVEIFGVDYSNGYSGARPFGNTGVATINSRNGITTYYSTRIGNFAIAIDLEEYRNGVLLSSTRLDLQILVTTCRPNFIPTLSLSNSNLSIMEGDKLCFDVIGNDQDRNQNLTLNGFGDLLNGANGFKGNKATFTNKTGGNSVSSEFCWQTSCGQGRRESYLFAAQVIDDGCPSKFRLRNYNIIVRTFSPTINIAGPTNICQGSKNNIYSFTTNAANPSDLTGVTYEFKITNGTVVSSTNNQVVVNWNVGSPAGTIEITAISRFGCKSAPFSRTFNLVPAPPKPVLLNIDTICPQSSKTYTTPLTNGNSYFWIINNGVINSTTPINTANVTWNNPGTGFLKLYQVNNFGCPSDTSVLSIWVSKPNVTNIIGRSSVCPNSSNVEYRVNEIKPNTTFQWWVSRGTISSNVPLGSIKVDWGGPGIGNIKLIAIDKFGCVSDTSRKTINKQYNLVADSIQGDTNICELTTNKKYKVNFVPKSIYSWTVNGGVITNGQGTSEITVDWGVAGEGDVSMFETNFDSINNRICISGVFILKVHIKPKPIANVINGQLQFCQNTGDYIYSINGFANSKYLWTINGDSSRIIGQGSNTITIKSTTFGNFKIVVKETSEFECEGDTTQKNIVIYPQPQTSPILGDSVVCFPNGNNLIYSVSGLPNSTFEWFVIGGTIINPSQNNNIIVSWNGGSNNLLKVIEKSDFGCPGDTVYLNVFYDNPSVYLNYITVNPPPQSDNGIDVYFELKNAPRYNTQIYIQNKIAASANSFQTIGNVNSNIQNYNHAPINTDIAPFEYRIKINNLCNDSIFSESHTNINLKGTKISAYNVDLNFSPYLGWTNNLQYDIFRLLLNKTDFESYEPMVTNFAARYNNGLEHFTQCYRVRAKNGTTDTFTWSNDICFNFDPLIFFPTAFSPNSDEFNNNFFVVGGALKSVEYSIFNRWGEKLFVGNDLSDKWNGKYKGVDQPQDVYMYTCVYIDYKGKVYSTKGTITLLR